MKYDLLRSIDITDDDIDWAETVLHGVSFDDRRRTIIKNMGTIDIQAFPGSGKTTALVAKLAILANKWPFSNCGICVLSHTNAAREEIESRLGDTIVGKKLLRYPHFIGTFQSFFDTFISIPWLRSHGINVKIIDTGFVKDSRWNRLAYGARNYLERNRNNSDCCQALSLPITIKAKKVSPQTDTYTKIVATVKDSMRKGEYTYEEMLLFAKKALGGVSCLPAIITNRFPILFVDEAQDTSSNQWELISLAFPSEIPHIKQSFGDSNQAIYKSNDDATGTTAFPQSTPLTLPDSMRFDQHIAELANRVALSKDAMEGKANTYTHLDKKHTVFLFDTNSLQAVLSAYKDLILDSFSDAELMEGSSEGCHVLAMVHTQNDINDEHKPRNIHDYWDQYDAEKASRTASPRTMIEYFRGGGQAFSSNGEMSALTNWIARGLRRYLNQYCGKTISATTDTFRSLCSLLVTEQIRPFRKGFLSLCNMSIENERDWAEVVDATIGLVKDYFDPSALKNNYFTWSDPVINEKDLKQPNCTVLHDEKTARDVTLHFGSIHSAKGRTHLSTLVVETFWHNPNIKSILPWICNCASTQKPGARIISRLKCHYVAFTRARALLCFAIPKSSVTQEQIDALAQVGWTINDIT